MTKVHKVLMVLENDSIPLDNRVWAEAVTLRERGFEVSTISPKGDRPLREAYICIEGIHVYRFDLPKFSNKYTAYILEYSIAMFMIWLLTFKVLFGHGFDVIHAANPPDLFFLIGLFYKVLGKKFVYDQHDLSPEMFQVKFKGRMKLLQHVLLFLEKCSYKSADVVITANAAVKQFAIGRGRLPDNRVFVVRNLPDLKRLKLVTPEPELKGGRRYLLAYVGSMEIQNGVEYTLYALDDLVHKRSHQDVSLVLMGDGAQVPTLRRLVRELELDDYVCFTGWLQAEDIVRYLTVADIGLIPGPKNVQNEHSTMTKTMEYMAMGKPSVAFDLPETRLLAQGACLYATPNLAEEFVAKLEILLNDDELRQRMGAIGRKRVEEVLNWDYEKKTLLLAYEMLFAKHHGVLTSDTIKSLE